MKNSKFGQFYMTDNTTGATKHDNNKARMDLLSPIGMARLSEVLRFGASGGKYEDHNWRKGLQWSRVIGATLRHLFSFMGGEDKDPESGLSHVAHAMCNLMFLSEFEETHKELDDRYKGSK